MNQLEAFRDTLSLIREKMKPDQSRNFLDDSLTLEHLEDMFQRIEPGFSASKLGRWLGWAQAAAVSMGIGLTLEDMKAINTRHANKGGDTNYKELREAMIQSGTSEDIESVDQELFLKAEEEIGALVMTLEAAVNFGEAAANKLGTMEKGPMVERIVKGLFEGGAGLFSPDLLTDENRARIESEVKKIVEGAIGQETRATSNHQSKRPM